MDNRVRSRSHRHKRREWIGREYHHHYKWTPPHPQRERVEELKEDSLLGHLVVVGDIKTMTDWHGSTKNVCYYYQFSSPKHSRKTSDFKQLSFELTLLKIFVFFLLLNKLSLNLRYSILIFINLWPNIFLILLFLRKIYICTLFFLMWL